MISNKILYRLFLPLIIIIMASCQGSSTREWSVKNESSTPIGVWAQVHTSSDTMRYLVESGDSRVLTILIEEKGNSDSQQPSDVYSYFFIKNENGEILTKDWTDLHDWDVFIEQTKSNPPQYFQTYEMIVTNADF